MKKIIGIEVNGHKGSNEITNKLSEVEWFGIYLKYEDDSKLCIADIWDVKESQTSTHHDTLLLAKCLADSHMVEVKDKVRK